MNINSAFPSKYLKAADLNGGSVIVTIRDVQIENVGQQGSPEDKPVLYFEGKTKGMVLNKTNAAMISSIARSDDTEDWTGVKIKLICAEVDFQGKLTTALRVRDVPRTSKAAPPPPPPPADDVEPIDEDSIPF